MDRDALFCVVAINMSLSVEQSLDHSSLSEEKRDRHTGDDRERRSFSSICLYTHTILGTHFQAQTDGLDECKHTNVHVNTHTQTQPGGFYFYFVTALVCPMLSLHTALKSEHSRAREQVL